MSNRLNKEARFFLVDILGEIDRIRKFLGNMTEDQFYKDDKTMLAVQKSIENIGEAAIFLCKEDPDAKKRFPQVKFEGWAGIKNKINHWYFQVDFTEIYLTAVEDTIALEKSIFDTMQEDLKILQNLTERKTSMELYKEHDVHTVRKANFKSAVEVIDTRLPKEDEDDGPSFG